MSKYFCNFALVYGKTFPQGLCGWWWASVRHRDGDEAGRTGEVVRPDVQQLTAACTAQVMWDVGVKKLDDTDQQGTCGLYEVIFETC